MGAAPVLYLVANVSFFPLLRVVLTLGGLDEKTFKKIPIDPAEGNPYRPFHGLRESLHRDRREYWSG